jgi:type IV secretory pathway ATPase VirB11/archaellum biosynthesis ATPase
MLPETSTAKTTESGRFSSYGALDPVLENPEIARLEIANRAPVAVGHRHFKDGQLGIDPDHVVLFLRPGGSQESR